MKNEKNNREIFSTTIFYSDPTWGNHLDIYKKAGFTKLVPYTYWDGESKAANTDQFVKDLENAPEKSVILFHACAHNPTGSDPSVEDWKRLAEVCKAKGSFFSENIFLEFCSLLFVQNYNKARIEQ